MRVFHAKLPVLLRFLWTRKCPGVPKCKDSRFHTHHLTRLGEWHYTPRKAH